MQKSIADIAIYFSSRSRILFSTIVIFAPAISILILTMSSSSSSSFFVFAAVDMPPQSPSPSPPPATTTEKPSTLPPSSSTTTTPPTNLPKIEEKKDPKDGDTILSSKAANGNTEAATKVDKSADTKTKNFNRGYVLGFAAALDPGLSKVFRGQINLIFKFLEKYYPQEFQIGFRLGFISASDYLDTFGLLDKSGGNPPAKK